MENEKYEPSKTVKKAALPAGFLVLIKIALMIAKSKGIDLDVSLVWEIAVGGYAGLVALINYLKHHKKGKPASG